VPSGALADQPVTIRLDPVRDSVRESVRDSVAAPVPRFRVSVRDPVRLPITSAYWEVGPQGVAVVVLERTNRTTLVLRLHRHTGLPSSVQEESPSGDPATTERDIWARWEPCAVPRS
jgi:hypothetical protein